MSGLLSRLKGYVVVVAATIGIMIVGYWRARKDGQASAQAENLKGRDKLQRHYDEIDRSTIDPAGSYDRLRKLSDRKSKR